MAQDPADSRERLVISYLNLRKSIGIIGILLPFVLAFGRMIIGEPGIQGSVSSYYHTSMRDVFVGGVCAIGVFLGAYRGYERKDDVAGDLACVFAVGLALFPTTQDAGATPQDRAIGALHLLFAGGFFLTLAYFSLALFRKTDPDKPPTPRKVLRNKVYTICGYAILACLLMIGAASLLPSDSTLLRLQPVFWLEAGAIVAFGLSWFTKGEAILADIAG